MLDDLPDLRDAVARYRAAVTAFGLPWADAADRPDRLPVDELCRIFDVDRVPEQPIWFNTEAMPYGTAMPDRACQSTWQDADRMLNDLSFGVALPFPWRYQLPLLQSENILFTFVLAGAHAGEVWRHQFEPDDWNPVRAAPGLVAMLTAWTDGFAAGVYRRDEYGYLYVGPEDDQRDPVDVLLDRGLDPFAFPVHLSMFGHEELIRARQRECGVDPDDAESWDRKEQLQEDIDAAVASLR